MSKSDESKEAISVVLPVHNVAGVLESGVTRWLDCLAKVGRGYEFLIVNDGSTDGTAEKAEALSGKRQVRVLTHEGRKGFGACLRTALADAKYPLFFYTSLDYPYTPSDLSKLLSELGKVEEILGHQFDVQVVTGRRTGRPVPPVWRTINQIYRGFMRFVMGNRQQPLTQWNGFGEHFRAWIAGFVFSIPLDDVNSCFKLYRRSVFDRFPIQCDGDFVHAELIAKTVFTTKLIQEVDLSPRPEPLPRADWSEWSKVLRDARFHAPPTTVPVSPPPVPEPVPASQP